MKTHDVAKSLMHLSRVLRAGPNVPMEDVGNLAIHAERPRAPRSRDDAKSQADSAGDRGAAIALLAQLAAYNKVEWVNLIKDFDLPVEVKPTDSVRDLLGRVLRAISDDKAIQRRLVQPVSEENGASPVLARALAILLNQP